MHSKIISSERKYQRNIYNLLNTLKCFCLHTSKHNHILYSLNFSVVCLCVFCGSITVKLHFPCWFPTHKIHLVFVYNQIEFATRTRDSLLKITLEKFHFFYFYSDDVSVSHTEFHEKFTDDLSTYQLRDLMIISYLFWRHKNDSDVRSINKTKLINYVKIAFCLFGNFFLFSRRARDIF